VHSAGLSPAGFVIGVGLLLAGVVINVIPIAVAELYGHARLQPVGGDQPAHDRHHHRARRRPGQGLWQGAARRQAGGLASGRDRG
jgi:hypothetical protein